MDAFPNYKDGEIGIWFNAQQIDTVNVFHSEVYLCPDHLTFVPPRMGVYDLAYSRVSSAEMVAKGMDASWIKIEPSPR